MAVPLRIYEFVKLPKGSRFTVGSSGLLGDRFVNVIAPFGPPKEYIPKNAVLDGERPTGMDDLTHAGSQLIEELRGTSSKHQWHFHTVDYRSALARSDARFAGEHEHLNEATNSLAQTSKKLDGVVEKADATWRRRKRMQTICRVRLGRRARLFQQPRN